MSHFILMLTQNDRTVANAIAVYERLHDCPLHYIGFKDVGLPVSELAQLARQIRADGRKVMLEVVATSRASELASIEAAIDMGVDYLLGGRHVDEALSLLRGSDIQYFPFVGHTSGHPTVLEGTMDHIVADARRLAALPGVHGLDLLAYRFTGTGDPAELTRRVVDAVALPVIAAGSINSHARVNAMLAAKTWGFTVGSALFDQAFTDGPFSTQMQSVIDTRGVMA